MSTSVFARATVVDVFHAVGLPIPPNLNRNINCPLPRHDDRTPSFRIVGVNQTGWVCFGECATKGGVADLLIGLGVARDRAEAARWLETRARCSTRDERRADERRRGMRSAYRQAPQATVERFIVDEMARARQLRLQRHPFDTPQFRAADVNAARARANAIFELRLAPIAAFVWEGYEPHDRDEAWPLLFERALSAEGHRYHHFTHPDAGAGDTGALPRHLYYVAADLAATWLRALAKNP